MSMSYEEETMEWLGEGLDFEEALAAPDSLEHDPYFFVRSYTTSQGDVWHAARVGDVERLGYLLQHEHVDPNCRDRWDSTPLYYACLAGHYVVAELLLESGASCSEYTFDGERCFYVALNGSIRQLLSAFAQRLPPLPPLGSALRALSTLCEDTEAQIRPPVSGGDWADFAFKLNGLTIPLHRCILSARSPYFRSMLRSVWQPKDGRAREVVLQHMVHNAQPSALKSLLVWMYTERLEIGISDVEAVKRIAKKCKLHSLVNALVAEQRTLRYYFKTVKREEQPRRFILQPVALPEEDRLSSNMSQLWSHSERLACKLKDKQEPANDFADVCLQAGNQVFRCHSCILAARSDYFAALLNRTGDFQCDSSCQFLRGPLERLPIVTLSEVSAKALSLLLRFVYTDSPAGEQGRLPGWLTRQLATGLQEVCELADRFLVLSLKKGLAEMLIDEFEGRPQLQGGLEGICRILLVADEYDVTQLREHCLHRLAARFSDLAARTAPLNEQKLFLQFLAAVAPKEGDLLDGSLVAGASKGDIVGGGIGGVGVGTLLQDLREAYLHDYGGMGENERDKSAIQFDAQLQALALRAQDLELQERPLQHMD